MKKRKFGMGFVTAKAYLMKGMSDLNFLKYLTYLGGITGALTDMLTFTDIMIIGVAFIVVSFIYGMIWDRLKMYHLEAEFGNIRNPFVNEMRKSLNEKKGNVPEA